MYKLFILLILARASQASFDVEGWISKYCKEDEQSEKVFKAENISISTEDLNKNFVISNKEHILIHGGKIGSVGTKFLNKFPKATILYLRDLEFKLDPKNEKNNNLETLVFEACTISGMKDSDFFKSFTNLQKLGLNGNSMDHKVLDQDLLGTHAHLKFLVIEDNEFVHINENSFEGLPDLETITLGELQRKFPSNLFKHNLKLKSCKLQNNMLIKFPKEVLPAGLTELGLKGNIIENLSKEDFKDFKSAKTLKNFYLGGNGLKSLDVGVFDDIENLEVLYLDYNLLENISKEHFQNLKKLKKLVLQGNKIKDSNVKDLGIEIEL